MNISIRSGLFLLAWLALANSPATAQTRMQVSASSAPVFAKPSADAKPIGSANSGEILFVSRVDGDWAAISPPERFDLWLNKDFIENYRVVAKSIQIRSGPGIQYDVVGALERGAPVMPRGEEGDWCKIAPPSSSVLWVKRSNLAEIQTQTAPIREVAAVPQPAVPAVAPAAAQPASKAAPAPKPEPAASAVPEKPAPQIAQTPAPQSPRQTAVAPVKIAPSTPHAAAPKPTPPAAGSPAPAPASPSPMATAAAPAKPAPPPTVVHSAPPAPTPAVQPAIAVAVAAPSSAATPAAQPTLRPATAIPAPAAPRATPPPRKVTVVPKSVPAPATAVASQKPREIDVSVDQTLVDDLDLLEQPNQGNAVQVEGELRAAPPFTASSPSQYRLLAYDGNVLEMVCHVHGDSSVLRQYIGKGVSIRGREYWVENSDMPVVVVGQIVPLAPAAADEPVMF